jgi:hypothetical protein
MPEFVTFISALSQPQCEVLLDNFLLCPRMRHGEDRILIAVGEQFPQSVWRFLRQRLDRNTEEEDVSRYEAIPRGLGDFRVPLARDPTLAVNRVREWYAQDNKLFQFRGGRVLHDVFPRIGPEIEEPLVSIVREGTDDRRLELGDAAAVAVLIHRDPFPATSPTRDASRRRAGRQYGAKQERTSSAKLPLCSRGA